MTLSDLNFPTIFGLQGSPVCVPQRVDDNHRHLHASLGKRHLGRHGTLTVARSSGAVFCEPLPASWQTPTVQMTGTASNNPIVSISPSSSRSRRRTAAAVGSDRPERDRHRTTAALRRRSPPSSAAPGRRRARTTRSRRRLPTRFPAAGARPSRSRPTISLRQGAVRRSGPARTTTSSSSRSAGDHLRRSDHDDGQRRGPRPQQRARGKPSSATTARRARGSATTSTRRASARCRRPRTRPS